MTADVVTTLIVVVGWPASLFAVYQIGKFHGIAESIGEDDVELEDDS